MSIPKIKAFLILMALFPLALPHSSLVFAQEDKPSQDAWNIAFLSQIGGAIEAVAVQDDYAYLIQGSYFVVLDISTPGNPVLVGKTRQTLEKARAIGLGGNGYAYAANRNGLWVIDIRDPTRPRRLQFYPVTPKEFSQRAHFYSVNTVVSGHFAYFLNGTGTLYILDITNPAAPVGVGVYDGPGENITDVQVSNAYAYITDEREGVRILDISDPADPVEIGGYRVSSAQEWFYNNITLQGDYAYVSNRGNVYIVDVSNPARPVEVSSFTGIRDVNSSVSSIIAFGDYVYVTGGGGDMFMHFSELRVENVSNPVAPRYERDITTSSFVADAVLIGDHIYLANGGGGLQILSVSNPDKPVEIGLYKPVGNSVGMGISDDNVYIADNNGVHVIDISNPLYPIEKRFHNLWGFVWTSTIDDALISGDEVYGFSYSGVNIVHLADRPYRVNLEFRSPPEKISSVWDVALQGHYAYAVDYQSGTLLIIDTSNANRFVEVASYDLPKRASGIVADGQYIYITDGGWRVLDVSNPKSPVEVGVYDTQRQSRVMAVINSYAYIADKDTTLRLVDVSDPTHPADMGTYASPGRLQHVAVQGNRAYLACGEAGLRVLDISDPAHPTEVGFYETPWFAKDVAVNGNIIYLTDSVGGLYILWDKSGMETALDEARGYLGELRQTQYDGFYGYPPLNLTAYDVSEASALLRFLNEDPTVSYPHAAALERLVAQQRAMSAALEAYSTLNSEMADDVADTAGLAVSWLFLKDFFEIQDGARGYASLQAMLSVLSWRISNQRGRDTVQNLLQMAGMLLEGEAGDMTSLGRALLEPGLREQVARYGLGLLLEDTQPMLDMGVQSVRQPEAPPWEVQGTLEAANLQTDTIVEKVRIQQQTADSLYTDVRRGRDTNAVLQEVADILSASGMPGAPVPSLWTRIQHAILNTGGFAILYNPMDCIHTLSLQSGPLAFNPSQRMAQCDSPPARAAVDASAWQYVKTALEEALRQQDAALLEIQAALEAENVRDVRRAFNAWQQAQMTGDSAVQQSLAVLAPPADRPAAPTVQVLGEQLVRSWADSFGLELAVQAYLRENTAESRAQALGMAARARDTLQGAVELVAAFQPAEGAKAAVPLLTRVPSGISPRSDGSFLLSLAVTNAGSAPLETASLEVWTAAGEKWAETSLPSLRAGESADLSLAVPPLPDGESLLRLTLSAGGYRDIRYLPVLPADRSLLTTLRQTPWFGPILFVIGTALLGVGLWEHKKEQT